MFMATFLLLLFLSDSGLTYSNAEDSKHFLKRNGNSYFTMNVKLSSTDVYMMYIEGRLTVLTISKGMVKMVNTNNNSRILADVEEGGNLVVKINSAVTGDAGRCCIKDMIKSVDIHCVDLIVTDVPRITLRNNTPAVLYQELNLTCEAMSTTKPDNSNLSLVIAWFKDEMFYSASKMLSNTTSILHDKYIDISYKDVNIRCIVTDDPGCTDVFTELTDNISRLNDVQNDTRCRDVLGISNGFTVQLQYAPLTTSINPSRNITKAVNSDVNITCTSDCNPRCETTWYKDGKILQHKSGGQIQIENIQTTDEGEYTCLVYNKHGNGIDTIFINVEVESESTTTKFLSADDNTTTMVSEKSSTSSVYKYVLIVVILTLAVITFAIIIVFFLALRKRSRNYSLCKRKTRNRAYRNAVNKVNIDDDIFEEIELYKDSPLINNGRYVSMNDVASPPRTINRGFHMNVEELVYAQLSLPEPINNQIHGEKIKTVYGQIDFFKTAPPLSESEESDSDDDYL